MYSLIALVHADDDTAPIMAALGDLGAMTAPVLEGNFNGGDVSAVWNFASEADYRGARPAIDAVLGGKGVVRCDWSFFAHGQTGVSSPGLASGIHRSLFLCADQDPTAERLARFEAEMVRMADYIPAIRNWRLSRVAEAGGELPWTHVWEQEYDDIGGLLGPYMLHPYHWAFIDRWFDHECPDWLANLRLCHSFAAYGRAVLS